MSTRAEVYRDKAIVVTAVARSDGRYGWEYTIDGADLHRSGPRGLPAPVVERLTALMPRILARPDLMARFQDVQTLPRDPVPTGEAFVSLIREQLEHWRAVARAANIEVS